MGDIRRVGSRQKKYASLPQQTESTDFLGPVPQVCLLVTKAEPQGFRLGDCLVMSGRILGQHS